MKTLPYCLAASLLIALLVSSCSKKESPDEPGQSTVVAWAVGAMDTNDVGMVLYSSDAGETWKRQGDSTLFGGIGFYDVWAIDRLNAWIVGTAGKIFRTLDGGQTWIPVAGPAIPGNPDLFGISIINNTTIWISGDRGTVFSSTDAGINWTLYDSTIFRRGMMQGIHAITPTIVYVAGEYSVAGGGALGYVARTLNGGITWDSIHLPNGFNQYPWIGVTATDSNHVVINGRIGHFAYTNNGGNTWITPEPISAGDVNDLVMLSNDSYWAALDYDQIFKTYDNGESWVLQQSDGPSDMFLVGIDTYYSQTALVVGQSASWEQNGKILKTTDGGFHWYIRHACPANLGKVAFAKNQPN